MLRAPIQLLLPALVLVVVFSALTNSTLTLLATLFWFFLFVPTFWTSIRNRSLTAIGSLTFSTVALIIWGTPFLMRNAGQRLSLLDNDNVYGTELALHFARDNASVWESWEATFATSVMPRVLGAFEGRWIRLFGDMITADAIVNLHVVFSLAVLVISMGALGAVFGHYYSVIRLSSSNSVWAFTFFSVTTGAFVAVGWLGQEFTFGAIQLLFAVAICAILLILPANKLINLLAVGACGLGLLLIWPLLLPLASMILIAKFIIGFPFSKNTERPFKPTLFLVGGVLLGLPLAYVNYMNRSPATVFGASNACEWCYGAATSPALILAVLLSSAILSANIGCLFFSRLIGYTLVLFLPSFLGMVVLKSIGSGQDGYYLGRVLAVTSIFVLIPMLGLLSSLSVRYIHEEKISLRFVILNQCALAICLVTVTAIYYPGTPMIWHNAQRSHSAFISFSEATDRFNSNYTPFLDGELLLASLNLEDSESRVVVPWTETCVKPGSSNYYLRWRAVFLNKVKSSIDEETKWAALSCPSQVELNIAKPVGKSLKFFLRSSN